MGCEWRPGEDEGQVGGGLWQRTWGCVRLQSRQTGTRRTTGSGMSEKDLLIYSTKSLKNGFSFFERVR